MAKPTEGFNMEAMMKSMMEEIKAEIKNINANNAQMNARFDQSNAEINAKLDATNQKMDSSKAELSKKLDENTNKLDDTNQKIEATTAEVKSTKEELKQTKLELTEKVEKSIQEQSIRFEERLKECQTKATKDLQHHLKKMGDQWTEQFKIVKQEMDVKISEVREEVKESVQKTQELETRTTTLEVTVEANTKIIQDSSEKVTTIQNNLQEEVERLQKQIKKRPAAMWMYPTYPDEKWESKLTFKGNREDNPVEFINDCEREMERIGTPLADQERIDFVTRHLKESANRWYVIVRDNIQTYQQFREAFENRYWNAHIQRQVRDQLEYGKYQTDGKITMDEYVIQQVEKSKHLRPQFLESEIVQKLAYHFPREIKLAIFTQGIKTIDQLLILVSQSENILRRDIRPQINAEIRQPNSGKKFTKPFDRNINAISEKRNKTGTEIPKDQ